jgi:hypothetical protein
MTSGAVRPSQRRPATKVLVFQGPCGTAATRRRPRGLRPRSRVMLVLTDVSSMNTSRFGFKRGCCPRQIARASATSGRSCSAARSCFFVCQVQAVQRTPDRAMAGGNAVVDQQPSPQLGNCRIGMGCHTGSERVFMRCQPRHHAASLLTRRGLPGLAAASQDFVDVRHADLEQRSRLLDPHPAVHRSNHPLPQILRVGPTTLPTHRVSPVDAGGTRITYPARAGSP